MLMHFRVDGTPRTWGNNEREWRSQVAVAARQELTRLNLEPLQGRYLFSVELIFNLSQQRLFNGNDLENLSKPIIDTLFLPDNPQIGDQDLTGILFQIDDRYIYSLTIKKSATQSNEGATITIGYEPLDRIEKECMMHYYRLIPNTELDNLIAKQCIEPSKDSWTPYQSGQVVCIYESNSPTSIFIKYGQTIAENRDLEEGDTIYVLEISNITDIENDKSQNGWSDSKVHFGPISIEKVSIIAEASVNTAKPGRIVLNQLVTYDRPKIWNIERNAFVAG
jgi:hypothetical protein